MDVLKKLEILGTAAKYDVCASSASNKRTRHTALGNTVPSGLCHSFTPDGRCISLLKVLMTNECQKDCVYCQNRCQRDIERAHFTPEELVKLFIGFYTRNYVEGLFLSSGVRHSSNRTMEEMLQVVEMLRFKHKFGGYIHLKILPGADESMVEKAVQLSNRVSVNLEVPNEKAMKKLSRGKRFQSELLNTVGLISKKVQREKYTTQTTQFVVGAAEETDQEIVTSVFQLYEEYKLSRAYFSAFQPVFNTPLEGVPATPLIREHRLYQTDFLIRQYGFTKNEILFKNGGNLDTAVDPKLYFAVQNPARFPVEINTASLEILLRVPGIGPKSARRIVNIRKTTAISDLYTLKALGVVVKRAAPFILLKGKSFQKLETVITGTSPQYEQLSIESLLQEGFV